MTSPSRRRTEAGISIVSVMAMSAAMISAMMAGTGAFQALRKQQVVVERSEAQIAITGTLQMILQSEPLCAQASWIANPPARVLNAASISFRVPGQTTLLLAAGQSSGLAGMGRDIEVLRLESLVDAVPPVVNGRHRKSGVIAFKLRKTAGFADPPTERIPVFFEMDSANNLIESCWGPGSIRAACESMGGVFAWSPGSSGASGPKRGTCTLDTPPCDDAGLVVDTAAGSLTAGRCSIGILPSHSVDKPLEKSALGIGGGTTGAPPDLMVPQTGVRRLVCPPCQRVTGFDENWGVICGAIPKYLDPENPTAQCCDQTTTATYQKCLAAREWVSKATAVTDPVLRSRIGCPATGRCNFASCDDPSYGGRVMGYFLRTISEPKGVVKVRNGCADMRNSGVTTECEILCRN